MNYFNEGNMYYNLKDYSKAIDYYKLSIENEDNVACSYYNSGVCYIKLKNFDKAIELIKKAILIQQESKYYFNLAYCYAMKENVKKALIYFNMAWSLDSTDIDCEKAINLIMAKNKKWDISN
ncbi:MAG: tetratricopeptide repeat protein [Clostridium sp.]|nr:tetratricopeptide repeat protein [Clostridium sp.]